MYWGEHDMKKTTENSEIDDYSRGMLLALTDALSLLASTGPQATVAAADMPTPPPSDHFTSGRRAGWDRAALIIRAAQANSLMRPPPDSGA
jgi:hypothetical protein